MKTFESILKLINALTMNTNQNNYIYGWIAKQTVSIVFSYFFT